MANNILLVLGHPSKKSYNNALLEAYKKGAEASYLNQQMNVFNYSYSGYGANFKQNPPEGGTSSNDNYINKDLMFGFKLSFGIKL